MNKQKNAFTLIELLVVVSIIALLVSILVPTLGKAKKQAQAAVCLNNLKQIGLGANFYAADNEEFVPRGSWDASGDIRWYELFMPYLSQQHAWASGDYRKVEIYRCPSFPITGFGWLDIPNSEQTVMYVVNDWRDGRPDGPAKISSFRRLHSETLYLADNEDGDWRPVIRKFQDPGHGRLDVFRTSHLASSDIEFGQHGRRVANARHRGDGCNVLYLDWHADWMLASNMTARMWQQW